MLTRQSALRPAMAVAVVVTAIGVDALLSACGGGSGLGPDTVTLPVYLTVIISENGVRPATSLVPPEPGGDIVLQFKDEIFVTFDNRDTEAHDIRSDPHPQHTNCPTLNVETVAPGQTKETSVLNQCFGGTREQTFHDETRPDDARFQGRIVRGR